MARVSIPFRSGSPSTVGFRAWFGLRLSRFNPLQIGKSIDSLVQFEELKEAALFQSPSDREVHRQSPLIFQSAVRSVLFQSPSDREVHRQDDGSFHIRVHVHRFNPLQIGKSIDSTSNSAWRNGASKSFNPLQIGKSIDSLR